LRSLGCRLGQGYIFSEPVDAASAGYMLRRPFTVPEAPPIDLTLPNAIIQAQEIQ